ncbi:tyrosine-type recombinase/integrase [Planctomycetota bacterium]
MRRIDTIDRPAARAFKTALASGELKKISKRPKDMGAITVDIHIRNCRAMFNRGVVDDVLLYNPFDRLSKTIKVEKRWTYIELDVMSRLLDACPNRGWRVLLSLCRFAGLRQGEALNLTWRDVKWGTVDTPAHLIVWAQKTKKFRSVPIVPELLPVLRETFELAEDGTVKIVTGVVRKNLWRDFQVIRRHAGVEPFSKWCHTLRKNREQDWNYVFPRHIVAEWMGHSVQVAQEHYLRVYQRDIEAAANTAIPVHNFT